jgi:hypothetical protein
MSGALPTRSLKSGDPSARMVLRALQRANEGAAVLATHGFARPWSPGTNGPVTGEPVLAPIHTEADLEKFKGKLKGKIVLLETPRPSEPITASLMRRFTDAELAAEALAPDPANAGREMDRACPIPTSECL